MAEPNESLRAVKYAGFLMPTTGPSIDIFTRASGPAPSEPDVFTGSRRPELNTAGGVRDVVIADSPDSIEMLLARKRIATAVLLRDDDERLTRARRRMRAQAQMWTVVSLILVAWGVLLGCGVANSSFFLPPLISFSGLLGSAVLGATLRVMAKAASSDR